VNRHRTSSSGKLFVVSAPSGGGKTTVVDALLKNNKNVTKTISHTSRNPRPGEKNGRDYRFVSEAQFRKMISQKKFVEWIQVYDHYYGTSRETIDRQLKSGKDVVLVIEENGARAIRKAYKNAVFVRLVPPNLNTLKRRMLKRPGTTKKDLKKRLASAQNEIDQMKWYPYTIVNDWLGKAVADLEAILRAERLRS
jgi:guanylate kinase